MWDPYVARKTITTAGKRLTASLAKQPRAKPVKPRDRRSFAQSPSFPLCAGLPTPLRPNRSSPALCAPLQAPGSPLTFRKRRIKRHPTRLEVELLHQLARLAGPMLAIHPDVFPLNRQRPFVLRLVERPDDLLEVHAAPARRAEVPTATRIAE